MMLPWWTSLCEQLAQCLCVLPPRVVEALQQLSNLHADRFDLHCGDHVGVQELTMESAGRHKVRSCIEITFWGRRIGQDSPHNFIVLVQADTDRLDHLNHILGQGPVLL